MRICFCAILLVLGFAGPICAQIEEAAMLSPDVTVDEVDQIALSQLARSEKFLDENQAADGLETLLRAIDQGRGRLIAATGKSSAKGFTTYVPLREEGQRRLCTLQPEALRLYRSQVDPEAKTLLAEATSRHSELLLKRLVEHYLASSIGDEAALLLGDAALARGDITTARTAWLKVDPSLRTGDEAAQKLGLYPALPWFLARRGLKVKPGEEATQLPTNSSLVAAHPDPNVPLAQVRSRLVIASILDGDAQRAAWELELFRQQHAGEEGTIAGRRGEYAALIEQMLTESLSWAPQQPPSGWPTFAGSPDRNRTSAEIFELGSKPIWTADLVRVSAERDVIGAGRLRVAEDEQGALSYHPIVVDNLGIVGDSQSLRAFELSSGKLVWEVLLREAPSAAVPTDGQVGVSRYTLSAGDGVVLACIPAPVLPARRSPTVRKEDLSRVVGVNLETRKLVFEATADDATMVFTGTPVLDRGRVFVGVRRQAEIRPQALVACYDLASGRQLWERHVCSAETLGQGNLAEFPASLLALQHETLYCNTNLGAIAALSAVDGEIRWLTKYPRASFPAAKPERSDRHFFRDLTPCLIDRGLVFCAPTDCERIFSLDVTSGQLVWTLPPNDAADVVHLLGAKGDHLIASGDYLYWIHRITGQIVTQFPPALPVGPGLALPTPRGWGRGILAGDQIFFPTESSLHIFAQSPAKKGMFPTPRRIKEVGHPGGNLVIVGNQMLVATADKLYCFETRKSED